jgi:LuxR family maltose regulon positive regulatory protein
LLELLRDENGPPIVTVVAPPGYGKTTLLAEWTESSDLAVAWVSVDERDNDPKVLLTYVAAALDAVEPVDSGVFDALASPGSSIAGVVTPRLGRAFASMPRPIVLVLDDMHLLHSRDGQAAIAVLADHLPRGSRLAIAARREPPLPIARLRAEGRIQEFGPEDLSLDREQSASLLRGAGVELPDSVITALHEKTEGWPVGLYLAALALRAGGSVSKAVEAFGGDDQFVSEYLHFEVLSRLPPRQVQFLRRSAVLERMSGPLCDAVLQETESAETLGRMQRSNQLLVPLDRRAEWYRYHHLFREMLLMELERSEPDLAVSLFRRAADWCERNGKLEEAIEYSISAGDEDTVARLLGTIGRPMYRAGRISTVQRWFGWLQERGRIDRYPLVAVLGSLLFALTGHATEAERLADAVEPGRREGTSPEDARATEALGTVLRSVLCRRGVEAMKTDAEAAIREFGSSLGTSYLMRGIAMLLEGDLEGADRALEDAVEVTEALGETVDQVIALAERSLLASARGAWDDAESLNAMAMSIVRRANLEEYATSALVYVAAARVALHGGDVSTANRYLVHVQRLREQLTHAVPHLAVQTRLELARAYVGLGEIAGARTLLREIGDLLRHRPDLGILVDQTDDLRAQLALRGSTTSGFQTLSPAELRLLPLLSTHFSFREIGEELFVSPHTVKSQAISIYRKLGVSSRSEAVQNARKIGLLEG